MSPFEHREDIASVEPLTGNAPTGVAGKGGARATMEGAAVTFRAVPEMTAQWLQRVVDCHIARNTAFGNQMPEMPNCPLAPKGVTAKVTATDIGFAVAVRSDNPDTANEIQKRSRALLAR